MTGHQNTSRQCSTPRSPGQDGRVARDLGKAFVISKCKVMHVGKRKPGEEYIMNGVSQCTTRKERDISITVSNNLKPEEQCNKAARTAIAVLNQISRALSSEIDTTLSTSTSSM
jgi:hypothetical protein